MLASGKTAYLYHFIIPGAAFLPRNNFPTLNLMRHDQETICHRVLPQDQPEPATTLGIRLIGHPFVEPNSRQNFTSGHFIPIMDLILDNSAKTAATPAGGICRWPSFFPRLTATGG